MSYKHKLRRDFWENSPQSDWHWKKISTRRQYWKPHRHFIVWRLAFVFGGLVLLFMAGIGVVLFLVQGISQAVPRPESGLELLLCAVPLVFMLLAAFLGGLGYRRLGSPLAEIMSAIEMVAKGDLDVRVSEHTSGELGRLARSFNKMTAELQSAEQQRRNLTADVAHELRTPLHIIQGNLEGMLDGVYEANPEKLAATLEETHHLVRLVNDLQTLSRAEAGQLPLHFTRILAADVLEDVCASFSAQAELQGITLKVELAPEAAALQLQADPDRIDQVLSNLVVNALRFTPAGGTICLGAARAGDEVQLTVSDNGAGIAPEELPYIFDRFWRGDPSRSHSSGAGSGLGLAIARQLVQAHGGTIEAASQPGQGTTFTILLPLA